MTIGTGPAANVWFPQIVCLFETIDQCVRRLRQEAMSWECLAWMKPSEIRSS